METIDFFGGTAGDLEALRNGDLPQNMEPEAVNGGLGDDVVVGGNSRDWLAGGAGDDEIHARRG